MDGFSERPAARRVVVNESLPVVWDGRPFAADDWTEARSGWKWQCYDRQKLAQDLHHGKVQPRVCART